MKEKSQRASKRQGIKIVVTCFMIMAVLYAPGVNLAGLYVLPVATEFGVTRTSAAMIVTIAIIAAMVGSLFSGKLLARFPLRPTVAITLAISGACYFINSLAPSLALIYFFTFIRGMGNAVVAVIPISMLINNWYASGVRGRYLGFAMVGSGVGAMLLNPVTGYLIESLGWRSAYRFSGILALLLIPPVLRYFVRHPQDIGLEPVGAKGEDKPSHPATNQQPDQTGLTAPQALRTKHFWGIFAYLILIAGCTQSWNTNGAAYLSDLGFTPVVVASMMSLLSLGLIFGKMMLGVLSDKIGPKKGILVAVSVVALSYVLAILASRLPWIAYLAAPLTGWGMACNTITIPLTVGAVFGNRDYGVLVGYFQVATSFGASVIPLLVTAIYDGSGTYLPAWVMLCGMLVLAMALVQVAFSLRAKYIPKQ